SSLYGLGMAPGGLLRNGFKSDEPVECPWVLGVRPDGTAFGVLMDTSYECRVDLSSGVEFRTDSPHPGVILFSGDSPKQVLTSLNELTGRAELPPRWVLGAGIEPRQLAPGAAKNLRDSHVDADFILVREFIDPLATGSAPSASWTEFLKQAGENHLHV